MSEPKWCDHRYECRDCGERPGEELAVLRDQNARLILGQKKLQETGIAIDHDRDRLRAENTRLKAAFEAANGGHCHKCQRKRGGKVPKHGHDAITVSRGYCAGCGKVAAIVPDSDYDWPKEGRKAIWD